MGRSKVQRKVSGESCDAIREPPVATTRPERRRIRPSTVRPSTVRLLYGDLSKGAFSTVTDIH